MKILAMDIGAGTIDVLLHETRGSLENSVKMVLPSPSLVYARRVSLSLSQPRGARTSTLGETSSLGEHWLQP